MVFIMRKASCRNISVAVDFMPVHYRGREQSWRVLILMETSLSSATFFQLKRLPVQLPNNPPLPSVLELWPELLVSTNLTLYCTQAETLHSVRVSSFSSIRNQEDGKPEDMRDWALLGSHHIGPESQTHISRSESVFSFSPSGLLLLGAG